MLAQLTWSVAAPTVSLYCLSSPAYSDPPAVACRPRQSYDACMVASRPATLVWVTCRRQEMQTQDEFSHNWRKSLPYCASQAQFVRCRTLTAGLGTRNHLLPGTYCVIASFELADRDLR